MLNYLSYGAIGIAMATAVLSYQLLAREQKKAEPSESILKMIKLFLALSVFFAVFFGVVELFTKRGAKINRESAIEFLQNDTLKVFSINKSTSDKTTANLNVGFKPITVNSIYQALGNITKVDLDRLSLVRKKEDREKFDVKFGELSFGELSVSLNYFERISTPKSANSEPINVNQWYSLGKEDDSGEILWYRLLKKKIKKTNKSIYPSSPDSPVFEYTLEFSEGIDKASEHKLSAPFSSTLDGIINPSKNRKLLKHEKWHHAYYVFFGGGLPIYNDNTISGIAYYQMIAIQMKLD